MRSDHEIRADIGKNPRSGSLNLVLPRLFFHMLYKNGVVEIPFILHLI